MGTVSFLCSLLLALLFHSCLRYRVAADDNVAIGREREALEIIIGGGGGYAPPPEPECPPPPPPEPECPPPPPPPSPQPPPKPKSPPPPSPPPPSPPPPRPPPKPKSPPKPKPPSPPSSGYASPNVARDAKTILRFSKKIEHDPKNVVKTWRGTDVCNKWKGIFCDKLPGTSTTAVAAADFNEFYFAGPDLQLTGFVDKLFDLAIFHANSNNFTGPVPKNIGTSKIKYFYEFDLSNNKYTGGFPMDVVTAKNLTFLDLRFNKFSGVVPPEVFNLDLDVLFINNNEFSQALPDNVGSTSALYLTFANNKFTGPIPKSIGRAKNLIEVLFLSNQFTGCLPYEIGFLSKATVFDVGCNKLTGPIPHSFACLQKMEILNLAQNEFYGPVPEMVCALPQIKNLSLSHNYFTQVGSECRKLIKNKRLDVRMNCILDLPEQRSAAECAAFFSQHKSCPNPKSLTYVPCKNYVKSSAATRQESMAAAPAPAPRTYDALKPIKMRP